MNVITPHPTLTLHASYMIVITPHPTLTLHASYMNVITPHPTPPHPFPPSGNPRPLGYIYMVSGPPSTRTWLLSTRTWRRPERNHGYGAKHSSRRCGHTSPDDTSGVVGRVGWNAPGHSSGYTTDDTSSTIDARKSVREPQCIDFPEIGFRRIVFFVNLHLVASGLIMNCLVHCWNLSAFLFNVCITMLGK